MTQRDFYIDRLRAVMTALVLLHHAAEVYGARGGFPWTEIKPSQSPTGILLSLFTYTDVAFLMGFFFLLAGYFTPASLERKGYRRFLADRFVRLGIPLVVYCLFLGPLTEGIFSYGQGSGFWQAIRLIYLHHDFSSGPLWFPEVLIVFSLAYCAWRAAFGTPLSNFHRKAKPVPATVWLLVCALAVIGASLAHRRFLPMGFHVFGAWIDFRAIYVFLFSLGIAAWRFDWLRHLSWSTARLWIWGLAVSWPALPVGILLIHAVRGPQHHSTSNGFVPPTNLLALWEPFVAWGIIPALLLAFRARLNHPSALWDWLNRRTYAVYIIHPPVLVTIALLLRTWAAPALLKFAALGVLACIATWLLADPLVRLPGIRRVV
jgi:peptidoglycan/LPS O-acetylase OafA/YrhL